jgi:hypothetical protein
MASLASLPALRSLEFLGKKLDGTGLVVDVLSM